MLKPFARAWFSVSPTLAICGSVNTADGTYRWSDGISASVSSQSCSRLCLHDARLVVGDVLELIVRRHVAERENATRRGALVLVDDHLAARVDLRRRPVRASSRSPLGTRPVATSSASPRNVEPSSQRDLDAVADLRARRSTSWWLRISHFLDAMSVKRIDDVVVVAAQQRAAADHQRHAAAERREDVRELACDESAADDDQMLGHVGDAHDGVAGVVGARRIRRSRRGPRPANPRRSPPDRR